MRVTFRFHGRLSDIAGCGLRAVELEEDCTLGEAIEKACQGRFRRWGSEGTGNDQREPVLVFLNTRQQPDSALLRDGDEIDLVVPNIGG